MNNRVIDLFAKKKKDILSVFFTAGFPRLEDTARIAVYLQQAGVDLIEIGIPFSDPVADGPVIQASNKKALDNGMTLRTLLLQVKELRKSVSLPILLMGYYNPVLQFGIENFCRESAAAGVDGVILPDLPVSEYLRECKQHLDRYDLCNIFLISPTTSEERIRMIDQASRGFIYAVSSSSTTGTRVEFSEEQKKYLGGLVEMNLKNPFMTGFGITDRASFENACRYGAGAIIGSAFVSMLEGSNNAEADIMKFVKSFRD